MSCYQTRKMLTFLMLTLSVLCQVQAGDIYKDYVFTRDKRQNEEPYISSSETLEVTTTTPEVTTKTPEVTTTKLEVTTKTPEVTTTTPEVTTKTPEVTTTKPEVTTKTPEVTTKTPEVTTKTPEVTTKTPEVTTTTPEVTTTTPESPGPEVCEPYIPPLPDFGAPGKRISEAKCDEYIWHLKTRAEQVKRTAQCTEYLRSRPNRPPVFAVIGGHVTSPGEYPHMGAVGWKAVNGTWVFKCGSSLISSKFLITAAHCSRSHDTSVADPVPKIVRLGDKNIADVIFNSQHPLDKEILKITKHPEYAAPKKYHDIAIIELVDEITDFTKLIQPACLWTKFDTSSLSDKANLTGWGVIDTSSLKSVPELQAAEVDIIDSGVCDKLLEPYCGRYWCGVQDGQICAGELAGGVDSCQGDSGGPLQVRIPLDIPDQGAMHYVIGVTSFGIGCARSNKPAIYTRVSHYIDWIEGIVWK